jgi:hypothetical protein
MLLRGKTKKEHVPRHIELTAVLRDLRQRIKNRIERFENLDLQSK